MNFPRLVLIATLLFPFLLPAQHRNKTGGPCSYRYEHSPAVVLYTYPKFQTYTEIVFSVNDGNGTDTISYSSLNNMPVPNDTVKKYNIRRGDVFTLETGHMYEGACNPLIRYFKLQPYKPDPPVAGEKPDERPCTFTTAVNEAYVISVVPVGTDSAEYEIYFMVASTRLDTITFSQVNKKYVSPEDVKKYNIKRGVSLTFIENFINTGSCEPYTREITFEVYDRKKYKR